MKKASIITVCYNSEKTIRKTLESVLNQTISDFEYLIIDGKSSDSTVSIAEEYRDKFESKGICYRIYSESDTGIYDAMDKGIMLAEGDVVGIVNSDDWYEPNAMEIAIEEYERSHYELFMCSLNIWRGGKKTVKRPKIRKYKSSRDFCHPSLFVSKACYERIGLYRRDFFYGDLDFWLRAFKKEAKISISENAIVSNFVFGGVSNKKSLNKFLIKIKGRYEAYKINGYSKLYIFEAIGMEIAKMVLV